MDRKSFEKSLSESIQYFGPNNWIVMHNWLWSRKIPLFRYCSWTWALYELQYTFAKWLSRDFENPTNETGKAVPLFSVLVLDFPSKKNKNQKQIFLLYVIVSYILTFIFIKDLFQTFGEKILKLMWLLLGKSRDLPSGFLLDFDSTIKEKGN